MHTQTTVLFTLTIALLNGMPMYAADDTCLPSQRTANKTPQTTEQNEIDWGTWHKRLDTELNSRFHFFAVNGFRCEPPLEATLSYGVTETGRIVDIRFVKPSINKHFNSLAIETLQSLDGNTVLLHFPKLLSCERIEKQIIFKSISSRGKLSAVDQAELIRINYLRRLYRSRPQTR